MNAKKAPAKVEMNLISAVVIGGLNVEVYRSTPQYKEVKRGMSWHPDYDKYERISRPVYDVEIDGVKSPRTGMHGALVDASEFGQWLINQSEKVGGLISWVAEVRGEIESCGHWTDDQIYAERIPFEMQ